MERTAAQNVVLQCIHHTLFPQSPLDEACFALSPQEWEAAAALAELHCIIPMVLEVFNQLPPEARPVAAVYKKMEAYSFQAALRYYQIADFTWRILEEMNRQQVQGVLLKGAGLGALYPKEELRKTNDVDFFVPDSGHYLHAVRLLTKLGLTHVPTNNDYHETFSDPDIGAVFELHSHVTKPLPDPAVKQVIDRIFASLDGAIVLQPTFHGAVPVLEPTKNAFYLVLHMLKHFLSTGFGLRNLIDWAIFLEKQGHLINQERFLSYIHQIHISKFVTLVTGACIQEFGLNPSVCPWIEGHLPEAELLNRFWADVINGGEFGAADPSRIRCSIGKEGGKWNLFFSTLDEKTRIRYPKASRYPFLRPLLWTARFGSLLTSRFTHPSQMADTLLNRNQLYLDLKLFKK